MICCYALQSHLLTDLDGWKAERVIWDKDKLALLEVMLFLSALFLLIYYSTLKTLLFFIRYSFIIIIIIGQSVRIIINSAK